MRAWASGDDDALRPALAEATQAGADPRSSSRPSSRSRRASDFAPLPPRRAPGDPRRTSAPIAISPAPRRACSTTRRCGSTPTARAACWSTRSSASRAPRPSASSPSSRLRRAGAQHARDQARRAHARAGARRGQADRDDAAPRGRRLHRDRARRRAARRRSTAVITRACAGSSARRTWPTRAASSCVIAPRERPLDIEITGEVPEPERHRGRAVRHAALARRRARPLPWSRSARRCRSSCRACASAGATGSSGACVCSSEQVADTLPVDPRIRGSRSDIVRPLPESQPPSARARLYRWVHDNVKEGEEADGRRVVDEQERQPLVGAAHACCARSASPSLLGREEPPRAAAAGPMSAAERTTCRCCAWRAARAASGSRCTSKYAPFGYVPAEARGMPGHALNRRPEADPGAERR